ncbi:hypothetical protein PV08_08518 [Exophiala spinifera]|uniref:Uncharacterized protein n=1 Tax=Exophiala spinifera TaxID=91928 RepID=A0A0D2B3S2_9EURO|nr:uncharacterized protein PV08_08518 [Exophiala spinifera]KIW13330.1 hypothetical protein PV08_08518 [Exophiala spinifera]
MGNIENVAVLAVIARGTIGRPTFEALREALFVVMEENLFGMRHVRWEREKRPSTVFRDISG